MEFINTERTRNVKYKEKKIKLKKTMEKKRSRTVDKFIYN